MLKNYLEKNAEIQSKGVIRMSYLNDTRFIMLEFIFFTICSAVVYILSPDLFWKILFPLSILGFLCILGCVVFIKIYWYGYDKDLTLGEIWNLRFSKLFKPEIELKTNDNQKWSNKNE